MGIAGFNDMKGKVREMGNGFSYLGDGDKYNMGKGKIMVRMP